MKSACGFSKGKKLIMSCVCVCVCSKRDELRLNSLGLLKWKMIDIHDVVEQYC